VPAAGTNVITVVEILGAENSQLPNLVKSSMVPGTPPTPAGGYQRQILSCDMN
jgi:hypothetical protein